MSVAARDDLPVEVARAVALGGEMGRRFGEYDWGAHPLGPVAAWPAEVRATVSVALTSRFPIVLSLDPDELFLVYNDAYIPMLGDKHPSALGRPGREVWWDIWDSIASMLAGVVETGVATWSDDLLLPIVTADRAEERYFTFSYSPVITAAGRVDAVFCAVNETTSRVLAERRLRVLNGIGSAMMETRSVDEAVDRVIEACAEPSPDLPFVAVYVQDDPDEPARLRAATRVITGLLPPTLDGLTTRSPGTGDLVVPLHSLSEFDNWPERALVLPTDGTVTSVSGAVVVGLNPRRPLDELYRGFCRLLRDQVSVALATAGSYDHERRRADALAELDRAKTVFLANVSHEFRTPLTLLLGPTEDAIAAVRDDQDQLERLDTVRRNAGRLLRLVNSLLDFSRVEAGRATAQRVRVDVGSLTEQIASSFVELCERAGIELVLRCAPAVADIDVQMWETVVLNVLSNAVKFTFDGSITVTVEPRGEQVLFSVADTGTGIEEHDLARLFDRFYRAGNARGRSAEGSGIGLSLVRSLVELNGGGVEVASEVGEGTTVTVTLSAAQGEPATADLFVAADASNPYVTEVEQWVARFATDVGERAVRHGDRELVLIADDNADMRDHLRRVLSPRWDTVVYGDGESALAGLRRHRPDMAVVDVMMPGLDGFGFVKALREDPELASTPVLMLSARAGVEAAGEGFASGADDYLPKPFASEDLVNRVAARLTTAAREQAVRARNEAERRREAAIAEFNAAMGGARSTDDVLDALLASPLGALGITGASLGLLDDRQVRLHYAGDVPTELRDRYHRVAVDAPFPLAAVIQTGEPIVMGDTTRADPRYEWVVRDFRNSMRAAVMYPLRDDLGRVVGALGLLWSKPHAFAPDELDAIATGALMASATVNRLRAAEREHRIAVGFQEHLLDLDRSSSAAVVAAVYEPAAEAMRVGGDWYLVTPLDDPSRVSVSVGDVVGHGLPAATVMSRLRAATSAATVTDAAPAPVLNVLERCARTVPGARCSTVAYVVLDCDGRTLSYACAGHPYPLVVHPDGTTTYLQDGRRAALAAARRTSGRGPGHADFPPGSLLLLYTDGLIERPGESLDDGFARLALAAADCAATPAGEVCDELLRRMRPAGGYTDDVALLALRCPGRTDDHLVAAVPAQVEEIPLLRKEIRAWLTRFGLDDNRTYDVLLSTCEAVANAIEHGSDPATGATVSVEAFARADAITVTVSDSGTWARDSSASRLAAVRGRGLTLINGLADEVDTTRTRRGTRVTMTYRRAPGATP